MFAIQMKYAFAILLILHETCLSIGAPKDIEDKLCPGTTSYIRDNTKIFSSLDQRCSLENAAYLLGSIYHNFSSTGKTFDSRTVLERWTNLAYLDASFYDDLQNPPPPPGTAPSCVFNERLARRQSQDGLNFHVALPCNPFDLTYCRSEYDDSLSQRAYCDCNYLYSIKEKDASGKYKCFARAGVPCKFKQNPAVTDPFLKLPATIDCHSSLKCEERYLSDQQRMYKKAFHGFGINPIVHEYMIENALGFCQCKDMIMTSINALNECIKSNTVKVLQRLYFVNVLATIACIAMK